MGRAGRGGHRPIDGQSKTAEGRARMATGRSRSTRCPPAARTRLTVKGKNTVTFEDVLVGEVWICSGQSNMQWSVAAANDARSGDPHGQISRISA